MLNNSWGTFKTEVIRGSRLHSCGRANIGLSGSVNNNPIISSHARILQLEFRNGRKRSNITADDLLVLEVTKTSKAALTNENAAFYSSHANR